MNLVIKALWQQTTRWVQVGGRKRPAEATSGKSRTGCGFPPEYKP